MSVLSLQAARPLIVHLAQQITEQGLPSLLRNYGRVGEARTAATARTWYEHLVAGESWLEAVRHARPRLADPLEDIIGVATAQSRLDHALHEVERCYHDCASPAALGARLRRLAEAYRTRGDAGALCTGCVLRELSKLIERAHVEQAFEVIVVQDSELFLCQTFVGAKPVRYREPCHGTLHAALSDTLAEAANAGSITLECGTYTVAREGPATFKLESPTVRFEVTIDGR